MQKFVPRCLVRIFHKERSRSIPLDPNLMFWCVSFRLGAFGTVSLLHETWCKPRHTGAFNVKVCATKSCHNFFTMNAHDPHHWTRNSCFGAFLSVWVHLGPFRYYTKTRQTGAINAKVCAVMSCLNFHKECSRSIPLNPNLKLRCVSFHLGAFGTVSLLHETWCKTRQTCAINVKFMPRSRVIIFHNKH